MIYGGLALSLNRVDLLAQSRFEVQGFVFPLSRSMVDHTAYSDIDTTPELAVRNIFGRQRAPAKLCLLFAGCGLLTSDCNSQLGQDPASVRKTFSPIIDGDDKLGAHLSEQECNWLTVLAIS